MALGLRTRLGIYTGTLGATAGVALLAAGAERWWVTGVALVVLGLGLAFHEVATGRRGASTKTVRALNRALEAERQRAAELQRRLDGQELRGRRLQRRSLLEGALSRRLGAIEAIAQSMVRDLGQVGGGPGLTSLEAAARRTAQRAEHIARLAGGEAREQQTTLALLWPRVEELLSALVQPEHHFVVELSGDLPPVAGSGETWAQILAALVENAVEAMPQGGVITVRAEASEHPGFARIAVQDRGRGIPAAVLPHVTEPFYTSRAERGADGLGLAMVASLVEALDGEIRLTSTVGAGTAVEIEIPFFVPPAPPATEPLHLVGTVLVADDDREMRRGMVRLLESFGLSVVEADSGTVARAHLGAEPERFCAAVLDVVMPGTPVGEVVASVRARRPAFPVLLVSGYDTMQMVDGVLAMGGVRFLRKPFAREEFFSVLRDLLGTGGAAQP